MYTELSLKFDEPIIINHASATGTVVFRSLTSHVNDTEVQVAREVTASGSDNSCIWANDDVCDVKLGYCSAGTDCADCAEACSPTEVALDSFSGEVNLFPIFELASNTECVLYPCTLAGAGNWPGIGQDGSGRAAAVWRISRAHPANLTQLGRVHFLTGCSLPRSLSFADTPWRFRPTSFWTMPATSSLGPVLGRPSTPFRLATRSPRSSRMSSLRQRQNQTPSL